MLCLTRRPKQGIIITNKRTGDKIKIVLIYVKGQYIKLALEANENYSIHREEIQEKIDKEEQGVQY